MAGGSGGSGGGHASMSVLPQHRHDAAASGNEDGVTPVPALLVESSKPSDRVRSPAWAVASRVRMRALCIKHALPLGFLIGLLWALLWPEPGQRALAIVVGRSAGNPKGIHLIEFFNNATVFFISGMTLRTDEFRHLARHWTAPVYGIVAILFVTPLLALGAKALPLNPPEFAVGLAIFCVMPTTLGAGVALTQLAHGNQALALLLTVVTNSLGVVTVPYLLHFLLRGTADVTINPAGLAMKLVMTVLAPSMLGMGVRASHPRARAFIQRHKTALSLFSTANLVMIVWQVLSGSHAVLFRQSGPRLAVAGAAAIAQHLLYLAFNWFVATRLLRVPPPEAVAVVIMASQKTLAVAVSVIAYLAEDAAQQGLFIIPCLIGQLGQIFIGSVIAARLGTWVDRVGATAAAVQKPTSLEEEEEEEEWKRVEDDDGGGDDRGEEEEEEGDVVDGIL